MPAIPYFRLVLIRDEQPEDRQDVAAIHRTAFGDHGNVVVPLVDDLRRSLLTEPGRSLVAVDEHGRVVGHVLFTRNLLDAPQQLVDVQVLSPLGVRPENQRQGVGAQLIRHGIRALDALGVPAVFLEGAPSYYARFGFAAGRHHGFRRPSLRIPAEAFQVRLLAAYAPWMTGTLVYRDEFWRHEAIGLRPAA